MKAAYIEAVGPPEAIQIGDLLTPEPGPGEVLVRVGASALNPIDIYLRSGFIAMPMAFPYVIACDLAGTVEKLGTGVTRFQVGDRVWGSNQGMMGRQGVTAEYASVHENWLYPTPGNLTDQEAAAIALTGITAHLGLFQYGQLKQGARSTYREDRAAWGRWSCKWPGRPGRGWPPRPDRPNVSRCARNWAPTSP